MNVLILSPSRTGSTMLQRVLTIFMLGSEQFDKPIINIHNFVDGLKYDFSNSLNKNILNNNVAEHDFSQSLSEIQKVINDVDYYLTGKVALGHIARRTDSQEELQKFYKFLNKNFFIIDCRRNNVFESSLSRCISNNLNTYTHHEKIEKFKKIRKNKITINQEMLESHLNRYKNHCDWVDNNFKIDATFTYEVDLPILEDFFRNLDLFKSFKSWDEMFNISWNNWNKCHHLISDVSISNEDEDVDVYQLQDGLPIDEQKFIQEHYLRYKSCHGKINEMVKNKMLPGNIPIKLHTLIEKESLVTNFKECITWYNQWADKHGFNLILNNQELNEMNNNELNHWYNSDSITRNLSLK